jgi:hypothetical protein
MRFGEKRLPRRERCGCVGAGKSIADCVCPLKRAPAMIYTACAMVGSAGEAIISHLNFGLGRNAERRWHFAPRIIVFLAICICAVGHAWGQETSAPFKAAEQSEPQKNSVAGQPSSSPGAAASISPQENFQHHFWDRENLLLFAGVGGARALDYSSTLNMRRRGRQEILLTNWAVDHHPLFAGIEIGGVGLSIGASYLLHRTGHHELERWFSAVHIGVTTGGAIRNYALKTNPQDERR